MIYGVNASANELSIVPISVGYVANAVTFNSATLSLASLACTDNADFSFAGWFNAAWDTNGVFGTFIFSIDPSSNTGPWFQGNGDNSVTFNANDGTHDTGAIINTPPIAAAVWQHIMWTVQTSPSRVIKARVNDIDVVGYPDLQEFGPTFTPIPSNGKTMVIGTDTYDDFFSGSMADISIWPGISFLTGGDISEATRRLFIDADGNPVDPAIAIASLGAPAVMLSGNATTFRLNSLGTAGAFTVAGGTLTNSATHP